MKSKQRIVASIFCIMMLFGLTACNSSKSYTFQVDTGDKVKVTLDTTDGYDLSEEDGTFTIEKDGEALMGGRFLKEEGFELYQEEMSKQKNAQLIKLEPADSPTLCEYTFEGNAGPEVDFLLKVNEGKTVVYLYTTQTQAEAEKLFQLLTFESE